MANEPRKIVTFQRADQIEHTATDWLIEGWMPKDSLVGLVGPSGSCKSFLAIDLACRVATGMDWHGCNVHRGQVFILAGEGRAGLRRRIKAWEIFTGITINDAPLFIADCLPAMTEDGNTVATANAIIEVADSDFFQSSHDPSLIIIDTVARALSGRDENNAGDMGRLVHSMDYLRTAWGATVIAVHHTGNGTDTQDRARGSSAFRAALDAEFILKPEGNGITVRATKSKDWRPPDSITLRKVEIDVGHVGQEMGHPETSLVLTESNESGTERERRASVFRLHSEGRTIREIAEETGVKRSTVGRWING